MEARVGRLETVVSKLAEGLNDIQEVSNCI